MKPTKRKSTKRSRIELILLRHPRRHLNHDRSLEEMVCPDPVAPRQWERHGHEL